MYAGIGSRETPDYVLKRMEKISKALYELNFILRSGGASGADSAFEKNAGDKKEIYLPWRGFNNNDSQLFNITEEAAEMAKKFHPNWNALSDNGRKYMARNCYQVLGKSLDNPVDFVICYTKGGKEIGGTSQAIRIAKAYDIPIFNIWNRENYVYFLNYLLKMITKPYIFKNLVA